VLHDVPGRLIRAGGEVVGDDGFGPTPRATPSHGVPVTAVPRLRVRGRGHDLSEPVRPVCAIETRRSAPLGRRAPRCWCAHRSPRPVAPLSGSPRTESRRWRPASPRGRGCALARRCPRCRAAPTGRRCRRTAPGRAGRRSRAGPLLTEKVTFGTGNWAHAHGGGLSVDRPRAPHPSRPYPGRARQVRSYVLDTFADVWPFRVTESVQCSGLRSRPPGPVRHGSRTGPGGPAERHAARSPPCATTVTTCCA